MTNVGMPRTRGSHCPSLAHFTLTVIIRPVSIEGKNTLSPAALRISTILAALSPRDENASASNTAKATPAAL